MTPDEATTRAVEVVGEHRGHETPFDGSWVVRCNCGWDSSETILTYALKEHDEHVVRALLAAHTDCETCRGTGQGREFPGHDYGGPVTKCSACGGSGRGESVLVAMLMEHVTDEQMVAVSDMTGELAYCDPNGGSWRPVYVERLPVDQ